MPDPAVYQKAGGLTGRNVLFVAFLATAVGVAWFLAWQLLFVIALAFLALLIGVLLRTGGELIGKAFGGRTGLGLAAFCILLLALASLAVWLLSPRVGAEVARIQDRLPASVDAARRLAREAGLPPVLVDEIQIPSGERLLMIARRFGGVLYGTVGVLATGIVVFFLGLYLAAEPGLYRRGFLHLVPPRHRDRADAAMLAVGATLKWWIIGQLCSMAVIGTMTFLGLWALGVPLAFTCALLTMLLTIIPNFGPILSVIPPVLLALSVPEYGPAKAGYVVLLYLAVQTFESYLITPMIQKRAVRMPPALLIISQVLMGVLLGAIGIALAAPLVAASMVLARELYIEPVLHEEVEGIGAG